MILVYGPIIEIDIILQIFYSWWKIVRTFSTLVREDRWPTEISGLRFCPFEMSSVRLREQTSLFNASFRDNASPLTLVYPPINFESC